MKGYASGSKTATVNNSSIDVMVGGLLMLDTIRMDQSMGYGDSGGPVYQNVSTNPDLYGIISGIDTVNGYTYASKASRLGTEITGASFNFSP